MDKYIKPVARHKGYLNNPAVTPQVNLLLGNLTAIQQNGFLNLTTKIHLKDGDVLCRANEEIETIYLPLQSIISLWIAQPKTIATKVGLIGYEGLWGCTALLHTLVAPAEARVQYPGAALAIPVHNFLEFVQSDQEITKLFQRYLFVQYSQMLLTGTCDGSHLIEERLARLLLMISDKIRSTNFYTLHSHLSELLGVQRAGVTKAAQSLHNKRLINYVRGNISIISISGLKAASCNCYSQEIQIYESNLN